ncbi:MAG: hypothetical protein AVDCRST_MAG89-4277, partial [uncultured Gemmatimonadetes bacterium]
EASRRRGAAAGALVASGQPRQDPPHPQRHLRARADAPLRAAPASRRHRAGRGRARGLLHPPLLRPGGRRGAGARVRAQPRERRVPAPPRPDQPAFERPRGAGGRFGHGGDGALRFRHGERHGPPGRRGRAGGENGAAGRSLRAAWAGACGTEDRRRGGRACGARGCPGNAGPASPGDLSFHARSPGARRVAAGAARPGLRAVPHPGKRPGRHQRSAGASRGL